MKKVPEDIFEKYNLKARASKSKIDLTLRKWNLVQTLGGGCAQCSEADLRVLCFHHKSGGMGSDEWRHMSRKERYDHIQWMIKSGKAEDIELLCMNCHTREFSFPKLHGRFDEFLADILERAQQAMMIGEKLPATDLHDVILVVDWLLERY